MFKMTEMVTQLRFNWRQQGDASDHGEDWDYAEVGKRLNGQEVNPVVVSIDEHQAAGEGDKWYYDIHLANGTRQRIFNPNRVYYDEDL